MPETIKVNKVDTYTREYSSGSEAAVVINVATLGLIDMIGMIPLNGSDEQKSLIEDAKESAKKAGRLAVEAAGMKINN